MMNASNARQRTNSSMMQNSATKTGKSLRHAPARRRRRPKGSPSLMLPLVLLLPSLTVLAMMAGLFHVLATTRRATRQEPTKVAVPVLTGQRRSSGRGRGGSRRTLNHDDTDATRSEESPAKSPRESNLLSLLPPHFETNSQQAPTCTPIANASDISYTLVTQSSSNRLWMMEHHCQRWQHRIAIAIAVEEGENTTSADFHRELTELGCAPDLLSLVVVRIPSNGTADYPVNVLRNEALAKVATSHVVYLDIDFWPSADLHDVLSQDVVRHHWIEHGDKTALVIPAFQIFRQCRKYVDCRARNIRGMPHNRHKLLLRLEQQRAFQFDPTNRGGHGSTRYDDWAQDQTAEQLLEIKCFLSNRYEPYIAFRYCRDVPPFPAAFSGYGKNKMTWILHLRRLGWRFWQIGQAFVTHYPHLDSPTRRRWNGGRAMRQRPDDDDAFAFQEFPRGQNDLKFLQFKQWLYHNVPRSPSMIPICKDPDTGHKVMEDDDAVKLWVPRKQVRRYREEFISLGEEEEEVEPIEDEEDAEASDEEDNADSGAREENEEEEVD